MITRGEWYLYTFPKSTPPLGGGGGRNKTVSFLGMAYRVPVIALTFQSVGVLVANRVRIVVFTTNETGKTK
jgi:hypothetical protein